MIKGAGVDKNARKIDSFALYRGYIKMKNW